MKTHIKPVCFSSRGLVSLVLVALILLCSGCQGDKAVPEVVIYTSVDQVFAEPILKEYEAQSGVRVLAVYDVEATKTTGLVNRLLAEKENPQADVFWSGEFVQTILLKEEGILEAYRSPAAEDTPSLYMDVDGMWSGLGGRARVILVNTDLVPPEAYPDSIFDLLAPTWPGEQIGIANPMFGTTTTQAAALYAALGREAAYSFYADLQARGVQVVDGNSVVRDMVADGQLALGLTDTDDACGAVQRGAPVVILFPDQGDDALGTLIIPNTVALIADGPNPEQGRAFMDYLLSREVEGRLIESGWINLSLRGVEATAPCQFPMHIQGMQVGFAEIFQMLETAQEDLRELYIR